MPEFVLDPEGVGEAADVLSATPHDLHACAVVLRAAPSPLHEPALDAPRLLIGAVERFVRDEARVVDALAVGTAALGRHVGEAATSWVAVEHSAASVFRGVASW